MYGRDQDKDEEIEVEQSSDLVIFAIDARTSMYFPNEKGERHITNCLRVAQHVMKLRIMAQDNSKFGIILMGAKADHDKGEEGESYLLLQPLSTPSAGSIEELGKIIASFESVPVGQEDEIKYYDKCIDLHKEEEVLDLHSIMFFISTKFSALAEKSTSNRNKLLTQKYAKHVWLFTNDDNPIAYSALPSTRHGVSLEELNESARSSALSTAQQLQDGNDVNMMLWIIEATASENLFNEREFFMAFLMRKDEEEEGVYNRMISCHGRGFDVSAENVRNRFYKKHPIWKGRLDIGLGLMGQAVGVSCYRTLKIVTTPAKKRLHAKTLEPVESSTRYIEGETGVHVPAEELTKVVGAGGIPENMEVQAGEFNYSKSVEVTRSLSAFARAMAVSSGIGIPGSEPERASEAMSSKESEREGGHVHPDAIPQNPIITDQFEDVIQHGPGPRSSYSPLCQSFNSADHHKKGNDGTSSSINGNNGTHGTHAGTDRGSKASGKEVGKDDQSKDKLPEEYMNVQVLYYVTRHAYDSLPHLRLEEPLFLTASNSDVRGSTQVFTALLHQLHVQEKVGIVKYNYKPQARVPIPRLAAMVPQMQVLDAEGSVTTPAGFFLILFPFRAEIRVSPAPVPLAVKETLESSQAYIDSAKRLITAMALSTSSSTTTTTTTTTTSTGTGTGTGTGSAAGGDGKSFSVGDYPGGADDSQKTVQIDSDDDDFLGGTFGSHAPARQAHNGGNDYSGSTRANASYDYTKVHNPYLQSFYSRLEATALKSSKVTWDASVHDKLKADPFWMRNPTITAAVTAFKDVTGVRDDAYLESAKRKASTSNGGAVEKKAKKTLSAEEATAFLARSQQTGVTVPALKDICGELGILKGGKKADILARIEFEVQKIVNKT